MERSRVGFATDGTGWLSLILWFVVSDYSDPLSVFFFLFFLWLDRAGKERRASLDALSQRKVPDAHVTLQMG